MVKVKNEICKKNENTEENLIKLADYLFQQIKLQQEVRDRWFGHYLSIVAAVSTFVTVSLKVFEGSISNTILFIIASVGFLLASFLGVLFYSLYLHQRKNYRKIYSIMEVIQNKLFESIIGKEYENQIFAQNSFKPNKYGADYITLLIENIMCSLCLGVSVVFLGLASEKALKCIIIVAVVLTLALFIILYTLQAKYERRSKQ